MVVAVDFHVSKLLIKQQIKVVHLQFVSLQPTLHLFIDLLEAIHELPHHLLVR